MSKIAIYIFVLIVGITGSASENITAPFPVFLRQGFSSVLEFDETPVRIVIGDTQSFQVEKLENSLVLKCLVPYATTNMFVYFKSKATRLFIVTASEEAEPTYFKRFSEIKPPAKPESAAPVSARKMVRGAKVLSKKFEGKKDYLTLDFEVSADSSNVVRPNWELIRLTKGAQTIAPTKVWSARREVQKDSAVKARLIFTKPSLSTDLKGVSLIIPLHGDKDSLKVTL